MKIRKYFLVLSLILLPLVAVSQKDVDKIMKQLSEKIASYKCLYFEYTIRTEDVQEKTSDLQYGKVLTKGKKFKLATKDFDFYSDGKNQWQYLKQENEVAISLSDPENDDFITNPIGFITGDRKEFKQKLKGEVIEDEITLTEIDFYPRDIKAPYAYIRLRINEKQNRPYSIKYVGKDGVHYTVKINTYAPDIELPEDEEFVFDVSKYQNITVVDLRE